MCGCATQHGPSPTVRPQLTLKLLMGFCGDHAFSFGVIDIAQLLVAEVRKHRRWLVVYSCSLVVADGLDRQANELA